MRVHCVKIVDPISSYVMRTLALPFSHLNLRRNPFGELEPDERATLSVADVEHLVEPLRRPRFTVQFLGGRGRGKTTHLLALRRAFPDAPYIHVHEGEKPFFPEAPLLLVDDFDLLPRGRRTRLLPRSASIALATHIDFSREIRKAGRGLECVQVRGVTEELLAKIIELRVEAARRGPGEVPRVGPAAVRALVERFGDDLRAVEHHLYHVFQNLKETSDVQV